MSVERRLTHMSLTLSKRCQSIAPSVTLGIDARAKALIAAGENVIGLAAGEPDFDTPEYIRDAAKYALDHGMTRYTPVAGTIKLREAIAKKLKDDNGLDYKPGEIIVCDGAKHALFTALAAILNPGDEVAAALPLLGQLPRDGADERRRERLGAGQEEDDFLVSAEQLAPFVTPRTKALILNSPTTPTATPGRRRCWRASRGWRWRRGST